MMRPGNDGPEILLCRDPVDFRKGINGLAALVEAEMGQDPFAERLFVFCNRYAGLKRQLWDQRFSGQASQTAAGADPATACRTRAARKSVNGADAFSDGS